MGIFDFLFGKRDPVSSAYKQYEKNELANFKVAVEDLKFKAEHPVGSQSYANVSLHDLLERTKRVTLSQMKLELSYEEYKRACDEAGIDSVKDGAEREQVGSNTRTQIMQLEAEWWDLTDSLDLP